MWWKTDPVQREADLSAAVQMLFFNSRNGYRLAANLEAYQVEKLLGTGVSAPMIVQMAREVIMIQNGVL